MTVLIIESALRTLLFATVVGAGLSLLRVQHVPTRKAAWTLILIASLAMPFLVRSPRLASLQAKLAWAVPIRIAAAVAPPATLPAPAAQPSVPTVVEVPASLPSAAMQTGTPSTAAPAEAESLVTADISALPALAAAPARRFPWPPIGQSLAWLYFAVAGALLLRLLIGLAAALRLWLTAEPVSPLVAPDGNVRASKRIASPVTVGSGIVLPADYPQWERSRLRMVLAHERSHVRQLDFWLQLLAGLYTAAFWFSPLGWWLRRKLAQLGEAMSDRAGMEAAQSGSAYAQVVLEFAAMPRRRMPGVAMASSGNLSRRIDSLLNEHRFRRAFSEGRRRALASLLLIPVALFAATVLIRVPAAAAQAVPANASRAHPPVQAPPAAPPSVVAGPSQAPQASSAPRAGQAYAGEAPNADQVVGPAQQVPPQAPPDAAPAPIAPPATAALPPLPPEALLPPLPPQQASGPGAGVGQGMGQSPGASGTTIITSHHDRSTNSDFDYHESSDGNAWAVASGTWSDANLPSSLSAAGRAEIERAHRNANGPFLWFTQGGKSYVVTDPVVVGRIEGMYQAAGTFIHQQQVLNLSLPNVAEILAQSQAAMAKAQLDSKQEWVQSMAQCQAEMKAAQVYLSPAYMAQLQKQIQDSMSSAQQWLSPEQQAKMKADMARVQASLQQEQARWNAQSQAQMQARIAEAQKRIAEAQQRMQEARVRWNAQSQAQMQARIAAAQKRMAEAESRMQQRDLDPQVESIIRQSLANGSAHPLQ